MVGIVGSVAAGLAWGWLAEHARAPLFALAGVALGVEAGVLAGAVALPAVLAGCAAGWGMRATWQRRLTA